MGGIKNVEKKIEINKSNFRSTILDNSGNIIAKTVITNHIGINPKLVINKQKLLINLKLIFHDIDFNKVKKRIKKKKYFRLKKELNQNQIDRLRFLGDKSIQFEEKITRI